MDTPEKVPMRVTVEVRGSRAVFEIEDVSQCEFSAALDAIDISPPEATGIHRALGDIHHLLIKADVPRSHFSGWQPIQEVVPAELPEVRILRLEPGDVLVVRTTNHCSDEEIDHICRGFKERFPDNSIALFEGVDAIDVLRKGGDR